eukprot:6173518-Pleurochrysis_carterae.AAC.2
MVHLCAHAAAVQDKLLRSDLVFLKAWVPVPLPTLYNPVTSLLAPQGIACQHRQGDLLPAFPLFRFVTSHTCFHADAYFELQGRTLHARLACPPLA